MCYVGQLCSFKRNPFSHLKCVFWCVCLYFHLFGFCVRRLGRILLFLLALASNFKCNPFGFHFLRCFCVCVCVFYGYCMNFDGSVSSLIKSIEYYMASALIRYLIMSIVCDFFPHLLSSFLCISFFFLCFYSRSYYERSTPHYTTLHTTHHCVFIFLPFLSCMHALLWCVQHNNYNRNFYFSLQFISHIAAQH